MNSAPIALLLALPLLAAACGSPSKPAPAPTPPLRTVAEQVAQGGHVYAASCARCHGDAGQGSKKAPPLVGAGALPLDPRPNSKRSARFHTALDIAQFATHKMPPDEDDRAKLIERDYWAVLAFALQANGVALHDPIGPTNAALIVLHP